jgi:hypothetical protein
VPKASDVDRSPPKTLKGTHLFRSRSKSVEINRSMLQNQRERLISDLDEKVRSQPPRPQQGADQEIPMTTAPRPPLKSKSKPAPVRPKEAWASAAIPMDGDGYVQPSKMQKLKQKAWEKNSTLFD